MKELRNENMNNLFNNVPDNWNNYRLKILTQKVINGIWGENAKNDDDDLVCVRVADFDYSRLNISSESLTIRNIPKQKQEERLLQEDDVLIEKSGGGEKQTVGRAVNYNLNKPAVCSNFISIIRLRKNLANNRYFVYILKTLYDFGINKMFIKQTTGIQNLDLKEFLNFSFFIPSFQEQSLIANYLDRKTAQIDRIITQKQRLLELYEEEKTAIINQAVTRGIPCKDGRSSVSDKHENRSSVSDRGKRRLSVSYKDSGIGWLGEIPEHWEVKKLKYVAKIVLGKMLTNNNKGGYHKRKYLRAANLGWLNVNINEIKEMWFSNDELVKLRIKENDLLVSEGGEVGRTCIWRNELEDCYIQNSVHKITLKNLNNPYYFLYQFYSYGQKGVFDAIVNRISIAHLTGEKIKNINFPIPSYDEQTAIVNYIEKEINRINIKAEKTKKLIELLKEYKQALISEVVTGKVKVI